MKRGREREIELLNKYYDVDEEKKIVNIPLKFEKASDMIEDKIINKKNYIIDNDLLADMTTTLKRLPVGYTVNYEFNINDYENYDRKKIVESFNDALELNNYNLAREKRRKFLAAAIFLITGISILFVVFTLKANKFFEQFDSGDVISEVFDIFGWVFIWEFITIMFLTPSELDVNSRVFRLKVRSISFYDGDDNLIETVDCGITYFDWEDERRVEKIAKTFLLISGSAFLTFGVTGIVSSIFETKNLIDLYNGLAEAGENKTEAMLLIIVLESIGLGAYLVEAVGGVMSLALYSGRRSKHITRFTTFFAVMLLLIIVLNIFTISAVDTNSFRLIFNLVVSIVLTLLYSVAYIALRIINRGQKKKKSTKEENLNA